MRLLDKLYAAGAILAAVFMVLIAALTLAQVVGRGARRSSFPMPATSPATPWPARRSWRSPHTFRSGGHIRVNLLLAHVPPRLRHASRMLVPRRSWR